MKRTPEGYTCHESGVNCIRVVWTFLGIRVWSKDYGPAYRYTTEEVKRITQEKGD